MRETTFVIGERVIVRSSAGAGSYRYTFDTIARDTATRWVTNSHGWFDKERLEGPRPKSGFGSADALLRASDTTALRGMWTDTVQSRVFILDRIVRHGRVVDVAQAREAAEAVLAALEKLEALA